MYMDRGRDRKLAYAEHSNKGINGKEGILLEEIFPYTVSCVLWYSVSWNESLYYLANVLLGGSARVAGPSGHCTGRRNLSW